VPGLIAVPPQGDKVARARSIAPQVEAGNVFLPGAPNAEESSCDRTRTPAWVQEFIEECAAFPNAAYDDQVDACSQALLRLAVASSAKLRSGGKALMSGLRTREL
jgi:predicted phage terminase large subunit-like protein